MQPLPAIEESRADADSNAVAAIRGGDRDRYRELVERYADKVFAVAWCRLGDRSLAEEAAQEAFIAGYRRLSLLSRADRFGAWITTIARHAAINLGLRHRSELRKRERWAIELDPGENLTALASGAETPGTSETLRAALADLPPIHRECLVLFYLENRSVTEAAGALGVSENAFKVRLHRARAALREVLEGRLESGLEQLRAPSHLASAVMLALPAQASGLAALGGLGSGLAKALPFGSLVFALQLLAAVPGLVLAWWIGRKELDNYRDPAGFRGIIYRRFLRNTLLLVGLTILTIHLTLGRLGFPLYSALFGGFMVLNALDLGRRSYVLRHPLHLGTALGILLLAVPLLGVGLLGWPYQWLMVGQGGFFFLMSLIAAMAPPRMDYSLFTRASHALLPAPNPAPDVPGEPPAGRLSALAFARFLGRGLLVEDWRRRDHALELRLTRVRTNVLVAGIPFYWGRTSRLLLGDDGSVTARLGEIDRLELAATQTGALPAPSELESRVTTAVAAAWQAFAQQDQPRALQELGEEPADRIFHQPPERTFSMRWRVWTLRVAAILMPVVGFGGLWFASSSEYRQARQMVPVALTESDVRNFLAQLTPATPSNAVAWEEWNRANQFAVRIPTPTLFLPAALSAVRTNALRYLPGSTLDTPIPAAHLGFVLGDTTFLNAVNAGLITPTDLERMDLGPEGVRRAIGALATNDWQRLTRLDEFLVQPPGYHALTSEEFARKIRFLAQARCLDLVDLSAAAETLAQCQVLPRNQGPLARRWPGATNRTELHGLFVPRFSEVLRDTHDALTILEAARALDRIDREACIHGILRLHRGHGLFAPHRVSLGGGVRGEARDTFAAYQSLRILNALDRVPDLATWEFRPLFPDRHRRGTDGQFVLAWEHLEAWCLREMFRSMSPDNPSPTPITARARRTGEGAQP